MARSFRSVRRRALLLRVAAQLSTLLVFPFLVLFGVPGSVGKVWHEVSRSFLRLYSGRALRRLTLLTVSGGSVVRPAARPR